MPSQFGQLLPLFNIINKGLYTAAETSISAYKMQQEADLAKRQAELDAQLATDKNKTAAEIYQQKLLASQARDAQIQKIAIIGAIGIAIVLFLVYFGISHIKEKRGKKYEYIIEEIK